MARSKAFLPMDVSAFIWKMVCGPSPVGLAGYAAGVSTALLAIAFDARWRRTTSAKAGLSVASDPPQQAEHLVKEDAVSLFLPMHKRADEWRAKDIMYFKFNKTLSLIPSFRVPPSAKQPPQGTLSRQDLERIVAQMLG